MKRLYMFGEKARYIEFWNNIGDKSPGLRGIYPVLGRYKSEEFSNLLLRRAALLPATMLLKTDLYEEAFGEDEVLFSLSSKQVDIFAFDISEITAMKTCERKSAKRIQQNYLAADARNIPFKDDSFDVILSTSTLDHFFDERGLKQSLAELKRVLKPGGCLLLALNNKNNVNFYMMLKIQELFRLKPYLSRFYRPGSIKNICHEVGLSVEGIDFIVHIISPLNSLLWLARRFLSDDLVDRIAGRCIMFFKWVGSKKQINAFTGWFIAIKAVKPGY